MADETVVNLTTATMELVDLQLRLQRAKLNSDEFNQLKQEIQAKKEYIQAQRDMIVVEGRTIKSIEQKVTKEKALRTEYEKEEKLIKALGMARRQEAKAIDELRKKFNIKKEFDPNITLGTLGKNLKALNFAGLGQAFSKAGGSMKILTNSLKALGGTGTVAGGAVTAFAMAAKAFHDNIFSPFARQTNVIGQTLGIGYEGRKYFSGEMLSSFIDRAMLGYSSEEYTKLLEASAGIHRGGQNDIQTIYNTAEKMGQINRLWGANITQLAPIFKAYKQQGLPTERLASHFDLLMQNMENTGFTTQEFTEIMANSSMYLKNFGVNLDVFAGQLKQYGQYVEQGQISLASLTPQNVSKAETGQMAFLAQMLQKYGFMNFGLDQNADPRAWARALKDMPIKPEEMKKALTQISLIKGSPLYNLVGGSTKNKRELELILAETIDTIFPKLASAYNISTGNMKASDVWKYTTEPPKFETITGEETAPETVKQQAINAQFMGASIQDKGKQILASMTDWLAAQKTSIKLTQQAVSKLQSVFGTRVDPITSSGGTNANT